MRKGVFAWGEMRKRGVVAGLIALLFLSGALWAADSAATVPSTVPATAPSALADGKFTIRPPYGNSAELARVEGVPEGTLQEFILTSQESRFYSGISKIEPGVVPFERRVVVYVPAEYVPGTMAPFMVVQDGTSNIILNSLPPVLDNMIHQKRIPVMIVIMISNGGGDGPGSERGLEYDTVSDKYTMFVEREVLPRIEKDYNIKLTKDPEGRGTMGEDSGGSCAFTMAWFHPELYHRVVSYSGAFVNQQLPVDMKLPHGAWEYHEHLISESDTKPIRIWLEAGQNDSGYRRDEASMHNLVAANQHMAAALKAKGYHYRLVFAQGTGHVDRRVFAQTLPEALAYVWQGYPIR